MTATRPTSSVHTTTSASSPDTASPSVAADVRVRRRRRLGTIRLIGPAGAAALALVAAGCGSDTTTTPTTPGARIQPSAAAAANVAEAPPPDNFPQFPRMDMRVQNDTYVTFTRLTHNENPKNSSCESRTGPAGFAPDIVLAHSIDGFCFVTENAWPDRVDAETDFNYRIGATRDVLWVHSKVPLLGDNYVKCEIRTLGTEQVNPTSAYICSARFTADGGHGNNPKPFVTVTQKPTE